MSDYLRVLLLVFSIGALLYVLRKIRTSQMQIDGAIFWILSMLALVVLSIFPGIVTFVSGLIGVESAANFVFVCVIFVLLIKVFTLSLQVSKLQYHIQQLTQTIALKAMKPPAETASVSASQEAEACAEDARNTGRGGDCCDGRNGDCCDDRNDARHDGRGGERRDDRNDDRNTDRDGGV